MPSFNEIHFVNRQISKLIRGTNALIAMLRKLLCKFRKTKLELGDDERVIPGKPIDDRTKQRAQLCFE